MRRLCTSSCRVLSVVAAVFAMATAALATQKDESSVAIRPTTYMVFNLVPLATYDVQKNASPLLSRDATSTGALVFAEDSDTGDRFVIVPNGVNPTPPTAPSGLAALGDDLGCFSASWTANPEGNVTGYTLYWGTSSVALGQSSAYDDSLQVPKTTNRTICGLTAGTYYVAIRARNGFGLTSGLSSEVVATVTTGATQGPVPPQNVQASETNPGCVTVTWQASTDSAILGYWVYHGAQSVAQGGAAQYTDSIEVTGGTSVTSGEICGFGPGNRYFVVRAYTASEVSGYSTERTVKVVGPDTTPPALANTNPTDGQVQVTLDTPIYFTISDAQSGVDSNTVSVTVDGTPVVSKQFFGDPSAYGVVCRVAGQLPANATVTVQVIASDRANTPNTIDDTWSFSTGSSADTDAPTICCESPADGTRNVDAFAAITFDVSDVGSGVDPDIEFSVNGVGVPYTFVGGNSNATITYANSPGFTGGSTVNVSVTVYDLAAARNSATLDFSFEVAAGIGPSADVSGAIVPNGYWAGDPSRPLEVQNLPSGWMVRIFDTSGLEVRRYKNDTGGEIDWAWDFSNGGGRRVARSLYLVRVVDDGGSVKNSGRFLVQMD